MKSSAFLISPARAEMCVERDLYRALHDRVIAGAALDPWWHCPKADEVVAPSEYPYQELDNVIMTPHTSGSTVETMARRERVVASNIERFLRGEPVKNAVTDLSRVMPTSDGNASWLGRRARATPSVCGPRLLLTSGKRATSACRFHPQQIPRFRIAR